MRLYTELPAGAQAAYSETYEVTQQTELHRSIEYLNGTVQFKDVAGKRYAYFAYRDALSGRLQQLYIGPDSPVIRDLQARAKEEPPSAAALARHAGAAISHGCSAFIAKHFRIIRQLSDARLFRAGGLLVGTHAFQALGNMLGVSWSDGSQSPDIDFAHPGSRGNISVALPADLSIDVQSATEALQMGFLPSLALRCRGPSRPHLSPSEPELRLDFLTPARRGDHPIEDPVLKVALQPLKFLGYLIEQTVQAVVLHETGSVVVNIPAPGRFALHKLLVAAERPLSERAQSNKDVRQAAVLLDYLLDQGPHELSQAWTELTAKGTGWSKRVNQSLKRIATLSPDLHRRLKDFHAQKIEQDAGCVAD